MTKKTYMYPEPGYYAWTYLDDLTYGSWSDEQKMTWLKTLNKKYLSLLVADVNSLVFDTAEEEEFSEFCLQWVENTYGEDYFYSLIED
jgi:hypothetical protein